MGTIESCGYASVNGLKMYYEIEGTGDPLVFIPPAFGAAGFSKEELASIKVPTLVIVGDRDFVRIEHAVEGFNAIPGAELPMIPSASHCILYSEQERVIPIKHFSGKA